MGLWAKPIQAEFGIISTYWDLIAFKIKSPLVYIKGKGIKKYECPQSYLTNRDTKSIAQKWQFSQLLNCLWGYSSI